MCSMPGTHEELSLSHAQLFDHARETEERKHFGHCARCVQGSLQKSSWQRARSLLLIAPQGRLAFITKFWLQQHKKRLNELKKENPIAADHILLELSKNGTHCPKHKIPETKIFASGMQNWSGTFISLQMLLTSNLKRKHLSKSGKGQRPVSNLFKGPTWETPVTCLKHTNCTINSLLCHCKEMRTISSV